MNSLSKEELKDLISKRKGPCISLFMPAYRAGVAIQQNQIRFRNLLRLAEGKLIGSGLRPQEAGLLEPAQGLSGNVPFWRQQGGGLAMFISADIFRHYGLPISFDELLVVSARFHVNSLLPVFGGDGRYYLLTLSQIGR